MGRICGTIVSSGKATLRELQTFYGVRDSYDLLEIIRVDNHNMRVIQKAGERQ